MTHRTRLVLATVALMFLSGCGGTAGSQASPSVDTVMNNLSPLPSPETAKWLSFDANLKTATVTAVAGVPGIENTFNFNGYTHGKLVITIPKGWSVTVRCTDHPLAGTAHSCSVVRSAGTNTPAFPGSTLPDPMGTGWVGPDQTKTFQFVPDAPMVGRLACLLTGHEAAGMWLTFRVSTAGEPSLGTLK